MCFSASASFVASGGLVVAGAASWRYATPRQKIIAAVPILFGVQQAIEGMQWMAIAAGASSLSLGYVYLFFAFLLWPTFAPLAVYVADPERRSITKWFLMMGAAVSMYLLVMLVMQPFSIVVAEHGILYDIAVPFSGIASAVYVLVTCGSLLVSSKSYIRWFGVAVTIGVVVAAVWFHVSFTSVWCMFAAIASALLAFLLWKQRTPSLKPSQ